ncbi:hypothetical protein An07g00740 [Aspergillus niger]|uniref:Uncharacterized protein n=2 Tax=Aspergillus niger TaxID=5061 RepID=A2QM43_ASPNC|nr:hypothetical protein An07g00740 [Aspergillus niger]CAK39297.1 hypothetical protein An07g00740 [Aspergillus niger]
MSRRSARLWNYIERRENIRGGGDKITALEFWGGNSGIDRSQSAGRAIVQTSEEQAQETEPGSVFRQFTTCPGRATEMNGVDAEG